eukprot:jgi/Chlat1/8044/Chrsp73S07530
MGCGASLPGDTLPKEVEVTQARPGQAKDQHKDQARVLAKDQFRDQADTVSFQAQAHQARPPQDRELVPASPAVPPVLSSPPPPPVPVEQISPSGRGLEQRISTPPGQNHQAASTSGAQPLPPTPRPAPPPPPQQQPDHSDQATTSSSSPPSPSGQNDYSQHHNSYDQASSRSISPQQLASSSGQEHHHHHQQQQQHSQQQNFDESPTTPTTPFLTADTTTATTATTTKASNELLDRLISGTHKATGVDFAVKIMTLPTGDGRRERAARSDIFKEVDILTKLDHENVIRLVEWFEEHNKARTTQHYIYLVTELLSGGELLDAVLDRGTYTEMDAKVCFRQLLHAIRYLHSHGTRLDSICGTPQYVAPEVISGGGGYPPFYDESEGALFQKIRRGEYSFNDPVWDSVGQEAKDLALHHKWITEKGAVVNLEETKLRLHQYAARMRIKKVGRSVMAIHRLNTLVDRSSRRSSRSATADAAAAAVANAEAEDAARGEKSPSSPPESPPASPASPTTQQQQQTRAPRQSMDPDYDADKDVDREVDRYRMESKEVVLDTNIGSQKFIIMKGF